MRHVACLVLAVVPFLMTACGSDKDKDSGSGGGASQRINGMTFADDASLPACNATTDGYLVYVTSTAKFKTCNGTEWADIDVKGEKGDKGDSATSDAAAAIDLYKKYRRSVFRVTLTCTNPVSPLPSGCGSGTSLGSAFLCGDGEVCTNAHVAACNGSCYQSFGSLKFQALDATDSLNSGDDPIAPFVTITDSTKIRVAGGRVDLAKVTVTGVPAGITPMPLSTTAAKGQISAIQSVLSMSFPLGFSDLYVDVGAVNNTFIGECDNDGGQAGYDCPKDYYDFSTTNDTDHGSSGSPLLDLSSGKVIGVTSAGTEGENANYTWAVDASKFGDFQ